MGERRMALFANKEAVGLDIGHGAVKAVRLGLRDKELTIGQMALLDIQQEGLLDEEELNRALLAWLEENGLRHRPFTVGIPQYLATTQVSDFPPGVKGEELRGMVSFETMQLAGLSDDAFSSDFHVMTPKFGRQNPVLIGVCRQSVIDERLRSLSREGLNVVDLGMNGLAVASTFYYLHPEALEDDRPSLILDMGDENATLLVVAGGHVLFVGSLLFGASRYTEALATHLHCSDDQADRRKRDLVLDPNDQEHPFFAVTSQLESEMRNAIEHWRAGEKEEISHLLFGNIWLTGGGAELGGLPDALARFFGCEVAVFGPADPASGAVVPGMTTAFGLALQTMGAAEIRVCLAPESLRWTQRRKRLFPYLLAAEVLFALLLGAMLLRYHFRLKQEAYLLEKEVTELQRCKTLIPQLQKQMSSMDHYERMLIPFVEKGNRAQRFLATINELEQARGKDSFFIYLADRLSYDEQRPKPSATGQPDRGRQPPAPSPGGMFSSISSIAEARTSKDASVADAILVDRIEQVNRMVVAGYVPYQVEGRYTPLLQLADKLNQGGIFKGVDFVPEADRQEIEEQIFNVWDRFWHEKPFKGRFTQFMFDLPFAKQDVNMAALAPTEPSKKGGKK